MFVHMQVDEFWHQHILDSTAYIPFCMRTAGEYIHHSPFYEKSHAFHAPCFKHTKQVYLSKYNEEPNLEIWGTMGESGGGCGDDEGKSETEFKSLHGTADNLTSAVDAANQQTQVNVDELAEIHQSLVVQFQNTSDYSPPVGFS